jgi:hypothetical protein
MLARQLYEGIIIEGMRSGLVYLEIGSYDGEGIALLSKAFPDKIFYCIDPFIEDGHTSAGTKVETGGALDQVKEWFFQNTSGCANIHHFDMTDWEFMKKELHKTIFPDVLFIDGNHSFECVTLDLQLAELFAKNRRLFVVMDDTVNIEGVVKALEDFKARHPEIEFKSLPDYGAVYFYIG